MINNPREECASCVLHGEHQDRTLQIHFQGEIALTSGQLCSRNDRIELAPGEQGLQLIIVEGENLQCRLPGGTLHHISGPCLCAIWGKNSHSDLRCVPTGAILRYTSVCLSPEALNQHMDECDQKRLMAALRQESPTLPVLLAQPVSPHLQALCRQVTNCPLSGTPRTLWLSGKALEIAALALAQLDNIPAKDALRLTNRDTKQLYLARRLLHEHMDAPPSLGALSLRLGLNTRKLTQGFRQLFGESVYACLQRIRLEAAWKILSEEQINVSCVAWRVGYSPAHLSVAFRKKFGLSPKALRATRQDK